MRIVKGLVALAAVIGLTIGGTLVAVGQADPEGGPPGNVGQNPNARMQVVVSGGASVGMVSYSRQKNLQSITNPHAGVFCIRPTAASGITPVKAVPNITVIDDFALDLVVRWRADRLFCPVKTFELAAYDLSASAAVNEARFAVTVG